MSFLEAWEAEKAFWAACTVDTYDLEETSGWDSYRAMVKQERGTYAQGDWVRSEEYRRDIAAAQARIADLEKLHREAHEQMVASDTRALTAQQRCEQLEQQLTQKRSN